MKKFANKICEKKILILIISLILLILSFIGMKLTKVNYDILVYLPSDIETIKGQNILTDDFNMGSYSTVVVSNLSNKDIIKLEDKIKDVDGVNNVISLYDVVGTNVPVDFLPSEVTSHLHKDNTDILLITFKDGTSANSTIDAVREIRKISKNMKLGGMSSMVLDTMNLSESEIMIYIVIAVVLCILVLELSLDSYLVPVLLLGNMGCAILFNLGSNIFLGEISYITKALVAVLQLGVTTDFSIFLYHSYEDKKKKYENRNEAMSEAIVETFKSVMGSSLTTIAGFLVLCTMKLTLGRDLGIVMAKGVLLGVISVITLFPALLLTFDKYVEKTKHKNFKINFSPLNNFVIKHNKLIFIIFLILLIPMYLANNKVSVYYKIDKSLPETLESISTNNYLRDNYNIVSPEIILVNSNLKSNNVNNMINDLKEVDGIDFVLSYEELKSAGLSDNMLDEDTLSIFKNDKYQAILVNSIYEVASDELNNQIVKVNDIVKKYDDTAIVAGEGPLMKDLINISDTDFKNVNYSSIVCIFIILIIVLRSLSLPILLILAIEFAIFTNMSISYFSGTVLPFVAPIVLGTIQLGATIDYAILLTTTYIENRKKYDKKEAMKLTLDYNGHSIFVSGLCFFAATFGVGVYSKLEMVGSLCTLISRGAIISMIVVITVLPSILLIFDKFVIKERKVNMNKKIKNTIVGSFLILSLFATPVHALSKNETVYSKLEYNGKLKTTFVNEHLINDEKLENINDYSELKDILNINGDETYKIDNNKIVWNSNKNDIFYQGKYDKDLPIELSVTYKLDGKVKELDDILGKKGKVSISIDYKNKDSHNVSINGKNETMYTPFLITTGMILDGKENTNININNGKVISTGTKNIVVGLSAPGLYESLNISSLKNMNNITITFETTNFKLPSIYNVSTPKLISSNDISNLNELDSLYDKTKVLQDNMNLIDESSKKIKSGSNTLKSSLSSSIGKLKNSSGNALSEEEVNAIKNKTVSNVNGIFTSDYLNSISNEAWEEVKNNMDQNDTKVKEIGNNAGLNILGTYLQATGEYNSYLVCQNAINTKGTDYTSYTQEELVACNTINNDGTFMALKNAVETSIKNALSDTSNYVAENVSKSVSENVAKSTAESVASSIAPTLSNEVANAVKNESVKSISESLGTLYNGVDMLDNGINELSNGITKYNDEGIKVLSDIVDNKVKPTSARVKKLVSLGNEYQLTNKNNADETKFVLVIDSKEKKVEEKTNTNKETKTSFIDKVKNLFR